jgi:D-3-phosphoglycerate dehydrogenase
LEQLALMRELTRSDRDVRAGAWTQSTRSRCELDGKTWGIVGFGRIGREVALRLQGWGVEILYTDVLRAPAEVERQLDAGFTALDDLLARADVVSLHVPLIESTHHLLDGGRIAAMRPTAYLVNVARGAVVDETALIAALRDGRLAGAALDVFNEEPLLGGHPLTELENVILTPHDAETVTDAVTRIFASKTDGVP